MTIAMSGEAMCGDLPRVVFEVVSPSELRAWRARNQKRRHLQDVDGAQEIVEIYQDEASIHIYRGESGGQWSFDAVNGVDAVLHLSSIGISIPLAEIYQFVSLPGEERSRLQIPLHALVVNT
jgi:Uma2 family endonuclease